MTYPPQQPHRPPYGHYPQPVYPQRIVVSQPPTSGAAVGSLIAGIIGALGGFCVFAIPCVVAVFLGHVALRETADGEKRGHGMAIAGLILGYLFVIPAVVLLVLTIAGTAMDSFMP